MNYVDYDNNDGKLINVIIYFIDIIKKYYYLFIIQYINYRFFLICRVI